MPSVTYMNQSAPFWDFVASLENRGREANSNEPWYVAARSGEEDHEENPEGTTPPSPPPFGPWGWGHGGFGGRRHSRRHWHENRGTETENEKEKEKDVEKKGEENKEDQPDGFQHHPPHPLGPWGWGHDFGGREFAHRGHGRRHWRENREADNEKEREKDGAKDVDMNKENNDQGEGPSGTGSDTEGRRRHGGRYMHGRCGKGRKDRENTNENGEGSGSETEGCRRRGGRGRWAHSHGRHGWGPYGHGPHGGPGHHGPPPLPHGFGPFGPGPFGPGQHDFGFGPRDHHHGGPHHERERGWGGRRGGPWGGRGGFNPWAFAAQFLNPENYESNTKAKEASNEDFSPEADIFDTPTIYVIHVSLPGAKKEDVGVNWDAEKSELSVAGVVYRPGDEDLLKTLAMDERKVGPFERKIRLGTRVHPAQIDADGIAAKLEDGILRIEVPKRLEEGFVEVRKVDIE